MTTDVSSALGEFAEELTRNFSMAEVNPAQDEDQLKGPVERLLGQLGNAVGLSVVPRGEALSTEGVRPDIGVAVDGLLAGHVELKAPGKGARADRYRDRHDRDQFKKLRDHPNLVYTDGNEWALYRQGELVREVVRAEGDVRSDGADSYRPEAAVALEALLTDFFRWEPLVPASPRALAQLLAPLTRFLRAEVLASVADPASALAQLAREWRDFFFPEADDERFADAYAQTVTYALLLARVEGETDLHARAVERLERRHGLLAQVLRWLEEPAARREVEAAVDLLERVIGAIDPQHLARRARDRDLWLYFYEDFLAAYDPKLRKQSGVYYTPPAVVLAQTRLVSELLHTAFDRELGFADEGVVVLDPAVGTGTYLIGAFEAGLEDVRKHYGGGDVSGRATEMAKAFHGFEILIGPYAVAHLRVAQRIVEAGGELPEEGVNVYLTDTLSSPFLAPPGLAHAPLFHRKVAEENERARRVKADVPVLVCIGNPPYFREVQDLGEESERLGGWVRYGDDGDGILADFLRDAPAVHVKNLYNLYVYFWRWALWKVYESGAHRGIVTFISASSYLRGPGFAGMRRYMREVFDELWILDLGGDGRGARKTENVFAIQTPVAIAVGVRDGEARPQEPARVHYARIDGTREAKYEALRGIGHFTDVPWQECFSGWTDPFLPETGADFFSWPALTDLFPWQHSGVQFKRTWPISPDRETLLKRWQRLVETSGERRAELFGESSDRRIDRQYRPIIGEELATPIRDIPPDGEPSPTVPYGYRTLDRQFCFGDGRLCSRPRPALWATFGARQLFMTSLLTGLLGGGPAAIVTDLVPDLHHFRGSFGGKDVIPLWRDTEGKCPNITEGVLDTLSAAYAQDIAAEELFSYCYAVLSGPAYVKTFLDELEVPGPHIPITRDTGLFDRAVELGQRLIWLHTYGSRFVPVGRRAGQLPQGRARCSEPVGSTPDDYPESHSHDEASERLLVGEGVFEPVSSSVRGYSVSGIDVIGSWLDYRMREGAGRRSSQLDAIRPSVWPAAFTEELLRLLWIVEHTVELGPELDETLAAIIAGPRIEALELPQPSDEERRPPG